MTKSKVFSVRDTNIFGDGDEINAKGDGRKIFSQVVWSTKSTYS